MILDKDSITGFGILIQKVTSFVSQPSIELWAWKASWSKCWYIDEGQGLGQDHDQQWARSLCPLGRCSLHHTHTHTHTCHFWEADVKQQQQIRPQWCLLYEALSLTSLSMTHNILLAPSADVACLVWIIQCFAGILTSLRMQYCQRLLTNPIEQNWALLHLWVRKTLGKTVKREWKRKILFPN